MQKNLESLQEVQEGPILSLFFSLFFLFLDFFNLITNFFALNLINPTYNIRATQAKEIKEKGRSRNVERTFSAPVEATDVGRGFKITVSNFHLDMTRN